MNPLIPYCLMAAYFWIAIFYGASTHTSAHSVGHPHKWNKFYFVHHWPVTVCKMNANDCKDPLMYWTIHGLWPDKEEECNRTWHFNISELKDVMEDMKQYWPDVLHPNHTHFWKHEWDKHGTCAAELESLNSEKKYFSKALELYKNLDLNSYLLKLGIKPGTTYYQMAAIKEALTSVYNVTPKIQCLPPEEGQLQIIGQIKFCLTKEFVLRNCTQPTVHTDSFSAHEDKFLNIEDLSDCKDTLTYYPSHTHTWKHFVANTVNL
ncbi:ribonuclease T2 isoform X1 [Sceloporus undulatus]|uniref:ribonuclease T2 isoform X1 n=2 Tax=Sceloporus undulatus TaxID=8520 RepID=UPI001C4D6678|nr:ribonuclease T2 isoform X1 [Sceloporus undulatus]XP_042301090.1 ribonuclease T2 isoform X1 [Sceloporus undulatus]XP_042301091.1 ribonuclease T2 isoform X1 [Sceloporus undulatus]